MDVGNSLSDAEMRLISINGQTIMLEGDFENINMSNEYLNEMLLLNNPKVDINESYNTEFNGNLVKESNDEPTKFELSIQGENNELETIQIGVEEAKALGLYFCNVKNEVEESWEGCTLTGVIKSEENINSESENSKFHSVPVLNINCVEGGNSLVTVNEVTNVSVDASTQKDNTDSLPEIGHLEGFQIPTSEDGILLPSTVNARMADGSYQTITLVPQVVNGSVTYTVHFSNLNREAVEKNLNDYKESPSSKVDIENNEVSTIDDFFESIRIDTNKPLRQDFNKCDKNLYSGLVNTSGDSILKTNKKNDFAANQLPIQTKIDNLISENESVISKCKKVKYGKKFKTESESLLDGISKIPKSNITKTKKVKFKNKSLKNLEEDVEQKKLKLSLLKPNKEALKRKLPHMNLNGRLEYPNLKAIDETASSLSYFKVKTKQPYFNVLPYPKEKTIPVQKQILPVNCDLQQAKNLISLQKFLETQKLELKIQPLVSNGNKIINIRPKPSCSEDVKVNNLSANTNKPNETLSSSEPINNITQEDSSAKISYQDNLNANDSSLKFLKSPSSDSCVEQEKESNSDCSNKINGIFIKNNPEYFSSKVKDGKADEHPLGSSENPIQLVQTGHTFHSRQPLSEAQLRQIASILQKQKFDSPNVKKNSIFDPKTNTRIVYRVVYPEDVDLKDVDRSFADGVNKRKRGRHKNKNGSIDDESLKKPSPLPRGPGRPKKNPSFDEDIIEEEYEEPTPKKKIPRTRSGRLSRPPRYMMKDYKRPHNSDVSDKTSNSNYDSDDATNDCQTEVKAQKLDKLEKSSNMEIEPNPLSGIRPQQRSKRNFKPEYRCPTCQKIYLGHTRMMWHLNKFPDHCNVEKYKENYYRKRTETKARRAAARRLNLCDVTNKVKQVLNSMSKDELTSLCGPILAEALTIWDFLLLRVNLLKESRKDEVDALLHELVILLEKLTKIAEDLFLPVFTKEAEKDEDCVEIDRMEVAIALGLPVGFYKVNNDNLNLLRLPLVNNRQEPKEEKMNEDSLESGLFDRDMDDSKEKLFDEKSNPWDSEKTPKKFEEAFWLESKGGDGDSWHHPEESSVKTLSTKFEPNLSTKILESSNDSIDDSKYEEPAQLIDLDSNSKDQSNSSGNTDCSPEHLKISNEKTGDCREEDKNHLWNENSSDKGELWNENPSGKSELWPNENSEMASSSDKPVAHLWNENSSEKVDETNSVFLDTLLSVANGTGGFLSETLKASEPENEPKNTTEHTNFIQVWEEGKSWSKEETLLSERMPGVRTAARLTSTPETNGNISFTIPNRRNSISDFTNINLEPTNLDIVLPPAKTLMKDCLKDEESLKGNVAENWTDGEKQDLNVNSEELMKMALESLTSQHDVINVPSSSFDSAMGILNQSQEPVNLFTTSETDGLDFNLPLPDHLLRSNFTSTNFQTTCNEPPTYLPTTTNIFGTTCTLSNSIKFDQFETNQKSKSLDDVMEFLETKAYEGNGNNFSFPNHRVLLPVGEQQKKKTKTRTKKSQKLQRTSKMGKKVKSKKSSVDYPKSKTIESIINEALFDSCTGNSKSLQIENSSPNGNSTIPSSTENYTLPIIPESLDEVENLDFLNQD